MLESNHSRTKVFLEGVDRKADSFLLQNGNAWFHNSNGTWTAIRNGKTIRGKPDGCYVTGRAKTMTFPFITMKGKLDHRFCPR